jgi:hypothetical protein
MVPGSLMRIRSPAECPDKQAEEIADEVVLDIVSPSEDGGGVARELDDCVQRGDEQAGRAVIERRERLLAP